MFVYISVHKLLRMSPMKTSKHCKSAIQAFCCFRSKRTFDTYSAVHNSGATLQNCPFCKFQVEFMICALIVYGQVIYFCKGFATRILLKKNFFLK